MVTLGFPMHRPNTKHQQPITCWFSLRASHRLYIHNRVRCCSSMSIIFFIYIFYYLLASTTGQVCTRGPFRRSRHPPLLSSPSRDVRTFPIVSLYLMRRIVLNLSAELLTYSLICRPVITPYFIIYSLFKLHASDILISGVIVEGELWEVYNSAFFVL